MMDISQEILSGITVFNKYAKYDVKKTRRETWPEICDRNKAMHIKKFPSLKKEINDIYRDFVLPKKVLPSMRSAQFAGAPIELSNNRIFNCAYAAIDHIDVFSEAMFLLLGGCFKAGTMIKTKSGDKPIESLTVDDEIYTFNEETKEFLWVQPVWAGKTPTANKQKVKITVGDREILTTADHKFLTETGWKEAQYLTAEDKIVSV